MDQQSKCVCFLFLNNSLTFTLMPLLLYCITQLLALFTQTINLLHSVCVGLDNFSYTSVCKDFSQGHRMIFFHSLYETGAFLYIHRQDYFLPILRSLHNDMFFHCCPNITYFAVEFFPPLT